MIDNGIIIELRNEISKQQGRLHEDPTKNTGYVQVKADILEEMIGGWGNVRRRQRS